MDRRVAIAAAIWVLVLFGAVQQGYTLPDLPHANALRFNSSGIIIVLMPLAFFTAMAFWIKGYPFDVPPLREWVNRRFGGRAYEEFLAKVRLILLFSIQGIVIGCIGFARAYELGAREGAYVVALFFISGGVSFLVLRFGLAKRGLSFE